MIVTPDSQLVLASASPRRKRLLGLLNVPFVIKPSGVDESAIDEPDPEEFARRAAREKCLDVAASLDAAKDREPRAAVVGADTVVHFPVSDGDGGGQRTMLGKPSGPDEAAGMLRLLAGRTHQVTTGVAVRHRDGSVQIASETSDVRFRSLTDAEIRDYVAAGESLDKAGAYAVQGRGGDFIARVDGDLQNVIGLPLRLLVDMLRRDFPDLEMPDAKALEQVTERSFL